MHRLLNDNYKTEDEMLTVKKELLYDMTEIFCSKTEEQGFLLGSRLKLNCIDYCNYLPAHKSGKYYYEPNAEAANEIIRTWEEEGICFCGLIHSHVVDKKELSENDIEYAKVLCNTYGLPVFWFAIAVVEKRNIDFIFWSVKEEKTGEIILKKVKKIKLKYSLNVMGEQNV